MEHHNPNEETTIETIEESNLKHEHFKKHNSNPKLFSVIFLSSLFGGAVALALALLLIFNNVIPIELSKTTASSQPTSNLTQTTALKDAFKTEGKQADLTNITEAVVGVTNFKKSDAWSQENEAGTGSGIIYKKADGKAYIVTNNHVVNNADKVQIQLADEKKLDAKVLGTDSLSDLAVLEVEGNDIQTVAKLGSSKDVKVGQTAVAIGNPLNMNLSGTVTKGIISGVNRSLPVDTNGDQQADWVTEVLQTDAAINPGNSGGALVTEDGKVIGINSMKIAQSEVEGIGFAIPMDYAKPLINQLEEKGEIERSYLGISMVPSSQVPDQYRNKVTLPKNTEEAIVIANVADDSPAKKAGLKQFDTLLSINDENLSSYLDLKSYLYANTKPGDAIKVTVLRDGKERTVQMKLKSLEPNSAQNQ